MTDPVQPRSDVGADDAARDLIARGLGAGIITQDQARRLAGLAAEGSGAEVARDDEALRFVTGFADIFVTIGLGLFFGAFALLARDAVSFAIIAMLAWGLAEFFTRRRRMALPSIVLLAIFAASTFASLCAVFEVGDVRAVSPSPQGGMAAHDLFAVTAALAGTCALIALHYWRFRVPVTIAAGVAAMLAGAIALLLALLPGLQLYLYALLLAAGLATFLLAMRFDLSDPARLTRRSDIAFWLHLLAAPLIVHPILKPLTTQNGEGVTVGTSATVLGIVLLLSVVALVTDRRAILVSGLVYAGIAITILIQEIGVKSWTFPVTILCLGAFVLLLSAGWHPLRRALLRTLPGSIAGVLPRPVGA